MNDKTQNIKTIADKKKIFLEHCEESFNKIIEVIKDQNLIEKEVLWKEIDVTITIEIIDKNNQESTILTGFVW